MKMKTKLLVLFLLLLFNVKNNLFAQILVGDRARALSDYNLERLILKKYPGLDRNKDSEISIYEARWYAPAKLQLNLSSPVFINAGVSFRGIEHFSTKSFILKGRIYRGKAIRAYGFDLSKIGGTRKIAGSPPTKKVIEEVYMEEIAFTSLDFDKSVAIEKLSFINCTQGMNLELLEKLKDSNWLNYLEVNNSGIFSFFNLTRFGAFNNLRTFRFRNTYVETIDLKECKALESVFIEGVGELTSLKLPTYAPNLEALTVNGIPKLKALDISKFSKLKTLTLETGSSFSNKNITNLDISKNTQLKTVSISNIDALTSLDFSNNTAITKLSVDGIPNIKNVDVSKLLLLKELSITNLKLKNIDISKNTALEFFDGYGNDFAELITISNPKLKELYLNSNVLTKINVKSNANLERLELNDNLLTEINVSDNLKLVWLRCQRNKELKIVNVANGNNKNMNEWDLKAVMADENPKLTCILVDDNVLNKIPKTWQKDKTASYSLSNEINFTDKNFLSELLRYPEKIDLDDNTKICTCEAESYKGALNLPKKGIRSMNGLEAFKNITGLNVSDNSIQSLNVAPNNKLIYLYAANNNLNSVSIQNLGELDDLMIFGNNLSSINFTGNSKLTKVNVSENNLTGIDLSSLHKLVILVCASNSINTLDVSSNPNLEVLFFANNHIIRAPNYPVFIDFTNNPKLIQLNVKNTKITQLDVSSNKKLTQVICADNDLIKFNLANGNNAAITSFDASGNSNLSCIQTDANFTPPNSWLRDGNTNFSDNCSTTASTEDVHLQSLVTVYPNPFNEKISIINNSSNTINVIRLYNVLGKEIALSKQNKISATNLNKGVYFLKIEFSSGKTAFKKLMKQ